MPSPDTPQQWMERRTNLHKTEICEQLSIKPAQMGFLKKAKEKAEEAAEKTKEAAEEAAEKTGEAAQKTKKGLALGKDKTAEAGKRGLALGKDAAKKAEFMASKAKKKK